MKRALLILGLGILLVAGHLIVRETVKATARELALQADRARKAQHAGESPTSTEKRMAELREAGVFKDRGGEIKPPVLTQITEEFERKLAALEAAPIDVPPAEKESVSPTFASANSHRKSDNQTLADYQQQWEIIDSAMEERFAKQDRRFRRRSHPVVSPIAPSSPAPAPAPVTRRENQQRATDHEVIMGRPVPVITHPGADWEVTTGTVDLPGSLTPGTWTADRAAGTIYILDPNGGEITVRGN